METIQHIKTNVSILTVAQDLGIQIKDMGNDRWFALCPLHSEDNASLQFYPQQGKFYCHGCKEHGDVLDLYGKVKALPRKEVIEHFAKSLNGSLAKPSAVLPVMLQNEEYYKATEALTAYYAGLLSKESGTAARAYLQQRGIEESHCQMFRLGYVPEQPTATIQALKEVGVSVSQALKWGLLAKSPKSGKVYNPFFGRIVFPVVNGRHVSGFTGRCFNKENQKYINSQGNQFFVKGRNLYGYDLAEKYIKETDTAILVEGVIDVITMHRFGVRNTVSSMGTAVTAHQLETLSRIASKIVVLMDGDGPGRKAGMEAVNVSVKAGLLIQLGFLPDGRDPDDFLRTEGKEGMEAVLTEAQDGIGALMFELEKSPFKIAVWIRQAISSRSDRLDQIVLAKTIAEHLGVTTERLLQALEPAITESTEHKEEA